MSENKKSAINLFKKIVKSKKNLGAIVDALKNAFEIDPVESIKWYIEISKNPDYKYDMFVQIAMYELLPKIVNVDKKSASEIFYNLLDPEMEQEYSLLPYEKPRKIPRRNSQDLWQANKIILNLFKIAPKEFVNVVFDLILKYRDIPNNPKEDEILDVAATIWYHSDQTYQEVGLLMKIEDESCSWAENEDPRLDEVIQFLEKESISLAKLVLVNILLSNPKKYYSKLFELANSKVILGTDDVQHMLPPVLAKIIPLLNNEQIQKLNQTMINFPVWKNDDGEDDLEERKFLISSIPDSFKNSESNEWLNTIGKDVKKMKTRGEQGHPIVFSQIHDEEKNKEKKFEELSEKEQENEIKRSISTHENIIIKSDKISFLENIESFLNINKEKMKKDILNQLEPIIEKFCNDSDPDPNKNDFGMEKDQFSSSSLLTYSTVRATAAACQLRLTYHKPSPDNIELCKKLSDDKSSLVREDVARNLRYLSASAFPASFEIAKKFQSDNHRILFYLTDYMLFITGAHPDESFYFCKLFLDTRGKEELKDNRDYVIDTVTTITIQMALKKKNQKFVELFNKILEDDTYNYVVKHTIAFRCKDESILFDDSLKTDVLHIYEKLFESPNRDVRNDADFFLLNVITREKKSFLPEIKPLLEKISKLEYDAASDDFLRLNIINYLEEFWKDIPEDAVNYLCTIYLKNTKLTSHFHKSRDTIKILDEMFDSSLISRESKKRLISVLMEFVKTGWPEANLVLKKLEIR